MTVAIEADVEIRPFKVDVPQGDLDDLRERITAARLPTKELVADASQGVRLATLESVARYWATEYDWRKVEAKLNALPQFTTTIDGLDIHFIHVKSRHENALPVIITHGWPGSVVEMLDVIGPLTDPTSHGGTAADAFDVVIPSLPGYGFSGQPTELGWSGDRIARAWDVLMSRLGYTRYVAQGGDQGATVTDAMARQAPTGLVAIHLNFLSAFPTEVGAALFGDTFAMGLVKRAVVGVIASRAEKEQEALAGMERTFWAGYIAEMNTRPQTIGYGSMDPLAMAAWMLDHDADSYEKISQCVPRWKAHGRPDPRSRARQPHAVLADEHVDIGGAAVLGELPEHPGGPHVRAEASGHHGADRVHGLPAGALPGATCGWAEKVYPNLTYFNEAPKGGHFAAWEEPQVFSEEVRKSFRTVR